MRFLAFLLVVFSIAVRASAEELGLDELDVAQTQQGWGTPHANKSVEGHPLSIGGQRFEHGLGTHAESTLMIRVNGATRFRAMVGVDDEVRNNNASVNFMVLADKKVLFASDVMHNRAAPKSVDVDITGAKALELRVTDGGDGVSFDHADWADAKFTYTGEKPTVLAPPKVEPYILTPPPSAEPRINSAKVFGVRPNHPFLYTIAATGERPMSFSVKNLPEALQLDERTGRITGILASKGEHEVTLLAKNAKGEDSRPLKIVVGDRIALTPPMGWNSWNCWAEAVSDEKVRASADAMVSSGLIDHGWTYVNIDDCWEVKPSKMNDPVVGGEPRNADGSIRTNKKFPDMKGLADYVHCKGLKIGIYSSPGPRTCGGYVASYEHELDDARQYAAWGFDYLKYDWCSYGGVANKFKQQSPRPSDLEIDQKPYFDMRHALDQVDRDIVYSLCQYGMGDVWTWGDKVGGNCWRTTGDITDTWGSMSKIGFGQAGHEKYAGPGHWNDPDMLVVGRVGWGPNLHPSRLNADEQYTHISLWCLLSAPMLIGCDMTRLDNFTKSLLTNDEVIAVNQDPLGKQAARMGEGEETQIWAKELEDGSKAVGLFNLGPEPAKMTVDFSNLGAPQGPDKRKSVRDLWRQKDLGFFTEKFDATVPAHGVVLVKVIEPY